MSLLYTDKPLVVNPKLASLIGLNEAIILQQMHYWLQKSNHCIDGMVWIYNSASQWKKQLPFFSESTIKRAIYKLEELELVFTGNYNKDGRDKTKWYSINHDALNKLMNDASCQNERWNDQIDTMQEPNLIRPLPETTTENTTDINNTDKSVFVDDKKIVKLDDDCSEENIPNIVQPKNKKQNTPNCPYQKIVELYEEILPELPRVAILTEKRKRYLNARWREHKNHQSLAFWEDYFKFVRKSQFLLGNSIPKEGNKPFKADFEWLINSSNFVKVIEGKYV